MEIKDTMIGEVLKYMFIRRNELNHTEMCVGTHIYLGFFVIFIVLDTVMLSIELFYLTRLFSFIGCYFEYLPLFIPYSFAIYP